ncbi:phosphoenolpyruvate carboxykinase (ATP) [Aquibacillus sediminis]|uniref:phosphoenolpyruvate carboxykinase (ATP) n=1 Tax=Aquibacillus sediminis TaxID=2574734 RepID=UPI0011088B2A|nr:phosphoenolpyruvate carboxykinase (ATP) [Aquibacillus sediminis]
MQTVKAIENNLFHRTEDEPTVYYELSVSRLMEEAVKRGEARLTETGALHAYTGEFTGRSPKDKYIVKEASVEKQVGWGDVNQSISPQQFDQLYQKALSYMEKHDLFVFDGKAGADQDHQLSVRIINELAWHNLFSRQLFIESSDRSEQDPVDFTVISLPGLKADPVEDGTNSETFIIISFEKKTVLIGGTAYAGEIKKSIFSVLNYLLPLENVLPMHCSANVDEKGGNTTLFFGLSGTGKTTLSADPGRRLIGDDEHGWTDKGIYNFEGGCYAKCIGLDPDKEPQIWNAIQYGSVLENVAIDPTTRQLDFNDKRVTENTRAAYSSEKIPNAVIPGTADHPEVIIFLTADAFGVLPPIAKLTKEQAMYHFLSGYTSKLAGTERGITEPTATFSTCFGEPFLPHRPDVYADLLGEKIDKHQARVYLVNTGWTGGPYGIGERIKLSYTRKMVSAAINGELENAEFSPHPVFGVFVPSEVEGVPSKLLNPRNTWNIPSLYDEKAQDLARRFVENFDRFSSVSSEICAAGPKVK